jgi:O-antigen/teichoic acid export membrane protein
LKSSVRVDVLWNLSALLFPILVALAAIPHLLSAIGDVKFGVLALAQAIIGFTGVFDLGVGRALTKVVAERHGMNTETEIPAYVRAALRIALAMSSFIAAAMWALWLCIDLASVFGVPKVLSREFSIALALTGLAVPLTILSSIYRGALEGFGDFKTVALGRMFFGSVTFGAPLLVSFYSEHLGALVLSLAAGRLLIVAWFAKSLHKATQARNLAVPEAARNLLRLGAWMALSNILSPFMTYLDRFVIAAVLGAAVVGFYTAPYEVVTKLLLIPAAISTALFPRFSRSAKESAGARLQLYRNSLLAIAITLSLLVAISIASAQFALSVWIGPAFASTSTLVWQILSAGVLFNGIAHIPFAALQGIGRADLTARLHLIELPIYVSSLLFLCHHLGIVGAAIAWTTRMAIDLAMLLFMHYRYVLRATSR